MLINGLIIGAALLLAGVAFALYDQATVKRAMVLNLSIQAQIVASNSVSALMFNDPETAEVTLSALRASPRIVSATIYDADDQEFATYRTRVPAGELTHARSLRHGEVEAHQFTDQHLVLAREVTLDGKKAGRVLIASDLQELESRRNQHAGIVIAILAVALSAALLLSWFSQRRIAQSITDLAAIARTVSVDRDYGVRAAVVGNVAEVQVLTQAFNDMLVQIQERDRSLEHARELLEDRVRQRTAELDAANKELEAFSYSVSHDLRAPLRHVLGFAELLEKHIKDRIDDRGRRYLETITSAATKMGQLIDDLLSFSRMARAELTLRPTSLGQIAREARDEVVSHNGVGNRHIEWRFRDLPDIEGDPAMLRQVMVNLLSNAVKYTATRPSALIEVGMNGGGADETVIYVRDNGVGFDMKYVDKLFGVFQRLHGVDEFEGTGIGLANVARIIRRHGGRVWAEGQVDHGATFYFSLPSLRRSARESTQAARRAGAPQATSATRLSVTVTNTAVDRSND
jgi:signal transduction histidine kinase